MRCAHTAAPVLTLKRKAPAYCVAAEKNAARTGNLSHARLLDGPLIGS
jgi:hypothetical protein